MFKPVLNPHHRPAELHGEVGDQKIFWIDMALTAKASADVGCDNPDTVLGKAEA